VTDAATRPASAGTAPARSADRTFIRATEIWVPNCDRRRLELGSGLYGGLEGFEAAARQTSFGYGEGLPGRAWAVGHPVVLKDLATSYFKRADAAQAAGLTCGVAVPIFSGPFLMAVMVLFCGDDREHVGALELWHAAPGELELGLVDGYFGTADVFEWSSRHTRFPRGAGLPGLVWETGLPVILDDLGRSRRFLRWESAQRVGINRGVGIPCGAGDDVWVLTLLSALGTPIARRFESWVPDATGSALTFAAGYCEERPDLAERLAGRIVASGEGTLGHVLRSGIPALAHDLAQEPALADALTDTGLETMIAMPIVAGGGVRAVAAWYL
jgi:hypothetical protein